MFFKHEPEIREIDRTIYRSNTEVKTSPQLGYLESNQDCRLLIGKITLVLSGPSPCMRYDGIENRYNLKVLENEKPIKILTLDKIAITDGESMKKAMKAKDLFIVTLLLRSWGQGTCRDISNFLAAQFDIKAHSFVANDTPETNYYPSRP